MNEEPFMLSGGLPFIKGPGFLTPTFSKQGTNSLWLQVINQNGSIEQFSQIPNKIADKAVPIISLSERKVGDKAIYAFRGHDAKVVSNTFDNIIPILRSEFSKLDSFPHLQKTIAMSLNDAHLEQIASSNILSTSENSNINLRYRSTNAEMDPLLGEAQHDFEHTQAILRQVTNRKTNILLIGSRGSGKTYLLRRLFSNLKNDGRKVILISSKFSHEPLILSIWLALVKDTDLDVDFGRRISDKLRLYKALEDQELEELMEFRESLLHGVRHGELTIIIDDLFSFVSEKSIPTALNSAELLADLFRGFRTQIVAATSQVLDWRDLFSTSRQFAPLIGEDFDSINIDQYKAGQKNSALDYYLRSDENLRCLDDELSKLLRELTRGLNVRRTKDFLNQLSMAKINKKTIKRVHDQQMRRLFKYMKFSSGNPTSDNAGYQFRLLANLILEKSEHTRRIRIAHGRDSDRPYIEILSADVRDRVKILPFLLMAGLLKVVDTDLQKSEGRVSFCNVYDQQWFVDNFSDTSSSGNSQLDLF